MEKTIECFEFASPARVIASDWKSLFWIWICHCHWSYYPNSIKTKPGETHRETDRWLAILSKLIIIGLLMIRSIWACFKYLHNNLSSSILQVSPGVASKTTVSKKINRYAPQKGELLLWRLTWVADSETLVARGVIERPVQVDFIEGASDAQRGWVVPTKVDKERTLSRWTYKKKENESHTHTHTHTHIVLLFQVSFGYLSLSH